MHKYTDCIVPEGGYPTQDGYIRVLSAPRKVGGKLKMLHRIEWEKAFGQIPDGYEINHKCKNRLCQNINHLECLPRTKHRTKDNSERYLVDIVKKLFWIKSHSGLTRKEISSMLGVKVSWLKWAAEEYPEIKPHIKLQ